MDTYEKQVCGADIGKRQIHQRLAVGRKFFFNFVCFDMVKIWAALQMEKQQSSSKESVNTDHEGKSVTKRIFLYI